MHMNVQTENNEEQKCFVPTSAKNSENQLLDTTFYNKCFENVCIENDEKQLWEYSKLHLCNTIRKDNKSMVEIEDDNSKNIKKRMVIHNPMDVDSYESKWNCRNSTYWNKDETCNQNVKSLNYTHVDFDNINQIECKEMIKHNNLDEKIISNQQNKHESIIEKIQGEEKLERNYKENHPNSIVSKHHSTNKETKV